ncbi:MAG TPA: SCO family protein [Candidatus Angelobacter sp.]|nr:SCO family protein [Candidatus Angelobacter sp.]
MLRLFLVLNIALLLFTSSAQETNNSTTSAPEFHNAKGFVVAVNPADKKVTINHGDIPGYMSGMTMPFDVKDTNELTGLQPGDVVTFRIVVEKNEGWIDQIHQTGAKTNVVPETGSFRHVRDVEPLSEGDLLPEYHFTNQLGQAFSTAQFKGQVLAIEFLFTRCPFPQYCPFMANNFAVAQKKLLSMPNAPANWHLLTISFDPEFDTPEVLKRYAEAHGADPARWTFATGALPDVTAIGEQFGLAFWKSETGLISHNLRAAVIDPTGHVQKIFIGNAWQPADLVSEIVKSASVR